MADFATLTVVSTEMEAEMICTRLREAGFACFHRKANLAAAIEFAPYAGPREVLVEESKLELGARRSWQASRLCGDARQRTPPREVKPRELRWDSSPGCADVRARKEKRDLSVGVRAGGTTGGAADGVRNG